MANGGEDLFRGDIAHAAVMNEAADRLVTWPAVKFANCFDRCRKRVERRPMPRAGRAEDSNSRGSECGGDMRLQKSRFGGRYFLGCAKYPKCKGTAKVSEALAAKIAEAEVAAVPAN